MKTLNFIRLTAFILFLVHSYAVVTTELTASDWTEFYLRSHDGTTVLVHWGFQGQPDVDHYEVWRKRGNGRGGSPVKVGHVAKYNFPNIGYTWLDYDLSPGVYSYTVRGVYPDSSYNETRERVILLEGLQLMTIHPNPVRHGQAPRLNLSRSEITDATYEVYDVLGRRVSYGAIPAATQAMVELDVTELPPGLYIVRASRGSWSAVRAMVILQ